MVGAALFGAHLAATAPASPFGPRDPADLGALPLMILAAGVVSLLGAGNIVFASDYPHPDAIFPGAVRALSERTDLDAATITAILDANARRCFGL